jgi:membrane associated rhomboid family serine protease
MRESGAPNDPRPALAGATPKTILVLVLLWFVLAAARGFAGREDEFLSFVRGHLFLTPSSVLESAEIWQPATWFWFHEPARPDHLLGSVVFLWLFGRPAERVIGRRGLVALFVGGGVAGGVAWVAVRYLGGPDPVSTGSAAAVAAVGTFAALRRPWERVGLLVANPPLALLVPLSLAGYAAAALVAGPRSAWSTVALAAGALWGALHHRFLVPSPADSLPPPPPRVPESLDPEATRDRVDALLAKISESGIESLTPEERAFLEAASTRFRG